MDAALILWFLYSMYSMYGERALHICLVVLDNIIYSITVINDWGEPHHMIW